MSHDETTGGKAEGSEPGAGPVAQPGEPAPTARITHTAPPVVPPPPLPPFRGSGPDPSRRYLAAFLVGLAGAWAVGVTVVLQSGTWFVEQVLGAMAIPMPGWVWPALALLAALLIVVATAPIAFAAKRPASRAAGVAWTMAALAAAILSGLRAIPHRHGDLTLAGLAALAAILALGVWLVRRRRSDETASTDDTPASDAPALLLAAAAGLATLVPWLAFGALGGVVDTVLAVLAAIAVGALAGTICGPRFWRAYTGASRTWLVLGGGSVAGVALAVLAGGIGASGTQLAMLLVLPPLAYVVTALPGAGAVAARATGVAVTIAAVGPLAFVDPEELNILLGLHDIAYWALVSAGLALAVAAIVAVAYGVFFYRATAPAWLAAGLAVVVAVAGGTVYAGTGQPGWHGEHLFVILRSQADLSGIPTSGERTARITAVYRTLVDHAEKTQGDLRRDLAGDGIAFTPYYLVNAIEVHRDDPLLRQRLERHPDVDRVLYSPQLRPLPEPPPIERGTARPPAGPQWNIKMVGADRTWQDFGATGKGIVVGGSDTGVDGAHPALRDSFRGGDDSWYDPRNGTRQPTDRNGHGTHTMGTVLGDGGIGVAPDAQWVACVNLPRNFGNPAHYLDCLQFMLAPFAPGRDPFTDGDPARAPHILTNSWGCPDAEGCDRQSLHPAVAALTHAGIFFVAAAGNSGPRCESLTDPPAPYAETVTVGAVDRDRRVAEFSSRGPVPGIDHPEPDIAAPGVEILSAMPGGTYARLDGTSMAAPHVAGVVALLWSADPTLIGDISTTTRLLQEGAQPANPAEDGLVPGNNCGGLPNAVGAGIADAYTAITKSRS